MADKQLNIIITAQDNASSTFQSLGGNASLLGSVLGAMGIANITSDIINLGKAAFQTGLQFQETMNNIQGNTGMTNTQIALMSSTVQKLGEQSGESMTDLATGFQHAFNVTQNMNDSIKILTASMKAAETTGANVSDVTNVLATAMHDFNIPASQAGETMAKLLAIAQNGNVNLQDLSGMFTVLASNASALGLKLDDVGAVYDALTKKYGDSNIAITMENQLLLAIADAHAKVKAAVGATSGAVGAGTKAHKDYTDQITLANDRIKSQTDNISKLENAHKKNNDAIQTAKDRLTSYNDGLTSLEDKQKKGTAALGASHPVISGLSTDFTDAGLKAKGLVGVMNDITKASNGNNEELKTLFPNLRSFEGALTLSSDKGKDVTTSLNNIKAASDKALDATYAQRVQTVNTQWGILVDTLKVKVIGAFNDLSPVMINTLKFLNWDQKPSVQKWNDVDTAIANFVKDASKQLNPWFQTLPGSFDKLHQKLGQSSTKFWEHDLPFAVGAGVGWVLSKGLPDLYNGTITNFTNIFNNTSTIMNNTWKSITDWWNKITHDSNVACSLNNISIHTRFLELEVSVDNDMKQVWKTISDWWGKIGDIFNSILKAAQNVISTVSKSFSAGVASQSIPARASGGYTSGLTLVGEQGPELVSLPTGSYVHNNSETKNMMGGQSFSINFTGTVNMDSQQRVQDLAKQIIQTIGRQNELAGKGYSV